MNASQSIVTLGSALALSSLLSAQTAFLGNEIQLSNGGEFVYVYSSPSVGGVLGAPSFTGDLAYKGVPENRFRTASGVANISTIEGIFLGDVDWPGGPPDFFDIGIDHSSGAPLDVLCPDALALGTPLGALLSLGNSGLPHPCVQSPTSTCSGSAGCPVPISGYIIDVALGSPIPITAGSGDVDGRHLISFLPGGMQFGATSTVGSCGLGDYVFQGDQSTDERQADLLVSPAASWCEGFQLGTGPPGVIKDTASAMTEINFGLLENVIEAEVSDPSVPFGPDRGGASLALATGSGTAMLAAHVTANPSLAGSLVFAAASGTMLPVPVSVFSANVCIAPDGIFHSTLNAWGATGALIGVDEDGNGSFDQAEAITAALPLPTISTRVFLQAFIVSGFGPIVSTETTVWTLDLRP